MSEEVTSLNTAHCHLRVTTPMSWMWFSPTHPHDQSEMLENQPNVTPIGICFHNCTYQ